MHILFFTYDVPYPPNSGGKTRAFNLLKYAKRDAQISLFSFTREGYDLSNLEDLTKIGIDTIELFPRRPVHDIRNLRTFISKDKSIFSTLYFDTHIQKTLFSYIKEKRVDLVHFESFYTGFYLSEELRKANVKQIYGSENIEYRVYQEGLITLSPLFRPIMRREVSKIEREEILMANTADITLAVTEKEAEYFRSVTKKSVHVIENGVAVENLPLIPEKKHNKLKLLFIGNFTYFPNRDGLEFFIKNVLRRLDRSRFHLTVIGKNVKILSMLDDTVETIEYVPDIYDAYAAADIFISPMRFGGGTNFKVLEAMAAGLPVVALKERAMNLGFTDGKEILIADSADDFRVKLEKLERDRGLRIELGRNARKMVEKHFSWDIIGKKLYNIWQNVIDEKN